MRQTANITLPFPLRGINRNLAISDQPNETSPAMLNVRPSDITANRIRGGQRPGLKKLFTNIGDGKPVVAMTEVVIVEVS